MATFDYSEADCQQAVAILEQDPQLSVLMDSFVADQQAVGLDNLPPLHDPSSPVLVPAEADDDSGMLNIPSQSFIWFEELVSLD